MGTKVPKDEGGRKDMKKTLVHDCQFIKLTDEVKKEGEHVPTPVRWGAMVMCAICGNRRILWTDGGIDICQK
jgi:hypothetical protein